MAQANAQLGGSMVAIVTPMHADGSVDWDSFEKLIDWHIAEGTDGIVAVGTTGESATLGFSEHDEVIERTVDLVDKRVADSVTPVRTINTDIFHVCKPIPMLVKDHLPHKVVSKVC